MDGLRLIPKNGMTLPALLQQVLCWARTGTRSDGRVRLATCWTKHVWVPAAVCTQYGAPPFTSQGQAITCPAEGDGQVPYYIEPSDVPGLNIADCTPLAQLPAPTGLQSTANTDTTIDLSWNAVTGADGYRVEYSATGGAPWSTQTAASTTTQLTGLTAATEYTIRVVATDSTGAAAESAPSGTITVTTDAAP